MRSWGCTAAQIFWKPDHLNAKQEKIAQFDKILQNFTCFYGILGPFLCEKCSVWNLAVQKNSLSEGLAYLLKAHEIWNAWFSKNFSIQECSILLKIQEYL